MSVPQPLYMYLQRMLGRAIKQHLSTKSYFFRFGSCVQANNSVLALNATPKFHTKWCHVNSQNAAAEYGYIPPPGFGQIVVV